MTAAETARTTLVALALVALAVLLWQLAPVALLLFAGVVGATAIEAGALPLVRFLHLPRTLAVGLVFALLLVAVVGGAWLFGKQLAAQASELWVAIVQAWNQASSYLQDSPLGATLVENASAASPEKALARVAKGTLTAFGAFADLVLVVFLSLYLALDPQGYREGFLRLLPPDTRPRVRSALGASGVALRQWLVGQLGAMAAVGILTATGLWLAGVPLAIPLGILSGLLDFVPVVGPFVAAIPGVLIAFSRSPELALYALLVYVGVQFFEGHVIIPLAQKWAVALPPAIGLLGLVAFGIVFGPAGVLFAMPLTVVAVVLVRRLYVEPLER